MPVMFVENVGLIAADGAAAHGLSEGRWWRTFPHRHPDGGPLTWSLGPGAFLYLGQTLLQIVLSSI